MVRGIVRVTQDTLVGGDSTADVFTFNECRYCVCPDTTACQPSSEWMASLVRVTQSSLVGVDD
jgi:hypothetical protein